MRRKLLLAALIVTVIGLALGTSLIIERAGLDDAPQYTNARVAWWKSPNQIGGTVNLTIPDSSIPSVQIQRESCTFENAQNAAVLSWYFLRNDDNNDVYRFTIRTNQQPEITRTINFDGARATVAKDDASGTSVTIESYDPLESS